MWLKHLLIANYKSCKRIQLELSKDSPNILIGINDCGKSTILKAIGFLLASKNVFHFPSEEHRRSDFSNAQLEQEELNELLGAFDLPSPTIRPNQTFVIGNFILEEADRNFGQPSSHLEWILRGNEDPPDSLWIMRQFDGESSSSKEFILTPDVIENQQPLRLFNAPNTALVTKKNELEIPNNEIRVEGVGKFTSKELLSAIYGRLELEKVWSPYNIARERDFFPEYQYLDWNVSMEELQNVAKNAIKTKIGDFLEASVQFAQQKSMDAQAAVDLELAKFTRDFAKDLPNIEAFKSTINFSVDSKLTEILINKTNTDGDIHLESQGDGIKRQIWFALIKWTALSSLADEATEKKYIWCFDEPETHLYPKAQRELFQLIEDVSQKNVQTVISTHSTVFIDRADFSQIFKFELTNGYSRFSSCQNVGDVFEALQIRNSDFLFFDKFLIVEGPTEEALIPCLFELFAGKSLEGCGIQLINLGGKNNRRQNQQILNQLIGDFNKSGDAVIYVLDNDATFELTDAERQNLNLFTVGAQDLEDSIDDSVWVNLLGDKLADLAFERESIEQIKRAIPNDRDVQSNQKFYSRLRSELKQRDCKRICVNASIVNEGQAAPRTRS